MIQSIRTQNFRVFDDESFEFDPGVNIIVGPNASGKTSLLEAVHFTARAKSFKNGSSSPIKKEKEWARIEAETTTGPVVVKLAEENGKLTKEVEIRGHKYKRLSVAKTAPTVVFEPRHLMLLNGEPALRREYLDSLLEQISPEYGTNKRKYMRALAQRNALLKKGRAATDSLFAWNIRLSELGSIISTERYELTTEINTRVAALYNELAGSGSKMVGVKYETSCPVESYSTSLLKLLERNTNIDMERGFTSVGPQREDLVVMFDGQPAQGIASRGETRTVLLALKIIESSYLEEKKGKKPLLLLDDVFSELDGARRRALTRTINNQQVLITTTDADIVVDHFMNSCNVIPLS